MSDEEDEYGDQNGYYEEDDDDRRRRNELDDYCDDNDFIEEDEGPRTTNPSEMLEERILMLEQWMDEAADAGEEEDPALYEKHQEYLGMYEELEIIAKKLRKTDKLLSKQPSATKKKLEKKRSQYLREVEDIVSYVVGDIFFLDGEEEENFVSQLVVTTNPLLGQPLESIIERPGMEDSQRFTLDNLPGFYASSAARLGSSLGSLGGSRGSFTKPESFRKPSSTGQLGVKNKRAKSGSKPRSLRKAKTDLIDDMIEEADQEDDPVFLSPVPKPNDGQHNESEASLDFREAILSPPIAHTSSSHKTNNNHHKSSKKSKSKSQSSSTSPMKSSTSLNHDSSNNSNNLDSLAEIKTLQKKLKKVEGLLNKPGISSKDVKKYEKKRREYMHSIEKLEYEVNSSIGSNLAAENEKERADRRHREQKVMKRKQEADRKRQELIKQAEEEERQRQKEEKEALKRQKEEERRRKEQERQRKVEDEIRALGREMLPDEDSPNRQQRNKSSKSSSGGNVGPPGTKEDYDLLKKKLEKAQKLVNNAITLKEAKKFEKKCKEYISKLEEYDDWNWEVSELEKLNKKDQQRQRDFEERKRIQKEEEEEEQRLEEERRKEDERWLNESMKSEQQVMDNATDDDYENDNDGEGDGYYDGDDGGEEAAAAAAPEFDQHAASDLAEEAQILQEDHRLVEKKLKKVEKLMKELVLRDGTSAEETKEYHKYEKKKKQYLRELGAMETSFRSMGGGESIDSEKLLGDYYDEDEGQLEEDDEEWQRRQEAEEQLAAAAAANDYTPEEIEAINLLNKKLKKVEKLMSDAMKKGDSGSKEFNKLQKKKKQYLEELDALQ